MKTTLLRAIRSEARDWWYHRELRSRNQIAEAIRREHESIRRDLKTIREAKLATIGRGGSTIYLPNDARITASWPMPLIAHLACPVVDLRTIPFDQLVHFSVKGPMVKVELEVDEGPGAFDWVTINTYVRLARAVGAEIHNDHVLHPTP